MTLALGGAPAFGAPGVLVGKVTIAGTQVQWQPYPLLEMNNEITTIAWSAGGHYMAATTDTVGQALYVWDATRQYQQVKLALDPTTLPGRISCAAWSPVANQFQFRQRSSGGKVYLWNIGGSPALVRTLTGIAGNVTALGWSRDGRWLAASYDDNLDSILVWKMGMSMDSVIEQQLQDKMVGRYRLIRMVGRGGMGEVWQASDTHLGRQVAIKLLPEVETHNRGYLERFANELRTAALLEHPQILALHDFGEQEFAGGKIVPYLVMPYVPGGTLRKRMQSSHNMLAVQRSLYFLKQAAMAIDYAHSKQVLHRDVKPENMLLQQDWLMLADFGLQKFWITIVCIRRPMRTLVRPPIWRPNGSRERLSLPAICIAWPLLHSNSLQVKGRFAVQIHIKCMFSSCRPRRRNRVS